MFTYSTWKFILCNFKNSSFFFFKMAFGWRMKTLIIMLSVWETATDLNFLALSQGFVLFFVLFLNKKGVCLTFIIFRVIIQELPSLQNLRQACEAPFWIYFLTALSHHCQQILISFSSLGRLKADTRSWGWEDHSAGYFSNFCCFGRINWKYLNG